MGKFTDFIKKHVAGVPEEGEGSRSGDRPRSRNFREGDRRGSRPEGRRDERRAPRFDSRSDERRGPRPEGQRDERRGPRPEFRREDRRDAATSSRSDDRRDVRRPERAESDDSDNRQNRGEFRRRPSGDSDQRRSGSRDFSRGRRDGGRRFEGGEGRPPRRDSRSDGRGSRDASFAPTPMPELPSFTTPEAFKALNLHDRLLAAIASEGYTTPTPIQTLAIPYVVDGRDLIGIAQTGTGKTAAFALPLLNRILQTQVPDEASIKVLVLTPTRELAVQVAESFKGYSKFSNLRTAVIFGGVGFEGQKSQLRRRPDVVVATPGRLVDLYEQGALNLSTVKAFVLDEADRMLDMGFIHDVKRILGFIPQAKQNLLFSATMPQAVDQLCNTLLKNPATVSVAPQSTASERVTQSLYRIEKPKKRDLLVHLLNQPEVTRAIVFTRTKHGTARLADFLCDSGIRADSIHGDKSQNARQRAMDSFRQGKVHVLVATDVASRGIDVDAISHAVNFDMPMEPETYIHRIGRTGRAGMEGIAWSFCSGEEIGLLRQVERLLKKGIPVAQVPEEMRRPQRAPRPATSENGVQVSTQVDGAVASPMDADGVASTESTDEGRDYSRPRRRSSGNGNGNRRFDRNSRGGGRPGGNRRSFGGSSSGSGGNRRRDGQSFRPRNEGSSIDN
jgi:ATP-dependent RNA helicase RhlE